MITIVITGVGGPLGQALIKAARLSAIPTRIVGTDRHPLSIGLGWVDKPYLVPNSSSANEYLAAIAQVSSAEKASLILPGSDSELELLSQNAAAIKEATRALVVASSPEILRVGLDKWETALFLERAGLHFPRSVQIDGNGASASLIEQFGFPLIAKPRRGSGSRDLTKIRSHDDLRYLASRRGEMVLQEYLEPDDEEYTVAVYTQQDGRQVGSICLKRELVAGNTYRAWVNQNTAVQAEAEAIVRALEARGPCNVQLRLTARGPVAFEINPRFSGTTAMRAHFGYNEVEMALRDYLLGEEIPPPVIRPGIALRFWEESYLDPDGQPVAAPTAPSAQRC